ncbi:RidA family protein [Streptomyces sporangiiformans]|uniref:RidA family protein n=1 Tax=Streptomyces sporangiiformans TaxID=2315329 RepID=A0A505DLL8_9ACTN|nr:RidA family protein [Streptomyces sporangiiformans]TPQ21246.1 RidA family protein [Streptomyces sporangiiformans]
MTSPEARLAELNLDLPALTEPAGNYVGAVTAGNLVFLSGQGPITDGTVRYAGRIGEDLTEEEGYQAARLTGLNLLSALRAEIGSLDRVHRVVKILGWVSSAPGFYRQAAVINGVSDLMGSVFGERGRHARSAIAADQLVLNIAVEAEMVVELRDTTAS